MKNSLILLLLLPCLIFAQGENDKITYLDSLSIQTDINNYKYYRIVKDYALDQNAYIVTDYYKSGKVKVQGISTKKDYISKTGNWASFYENGNMEKRSVFEESAELGPYTEWYEDGTKKSEGEFLKYDKDSKFDKPYKVNQFWSPKGIQTVIDGNGNLEDSNKEDTSKGQIKNGYKDGNWTGIDKKAKVIYSEDYKDGVLISGTSTDVDSTTYNYKAIVVKPDFKNGIKDFYNYVGKNFRTPDNGASGKVIIGFIIEKDGSISETRILRSLDDKTDREALRIMANCPLWKPGLLRGKKVRVNYSLPISIFSN